MSPLRHAVVLTARPAAVKSASTAFFNSTDTTFSSSDIRPMELLAPQSPLPTSPCLPGLPGVRLNQRLMENSLKASYELEKSGMFMDEPRAALK